jgi:hypothetical protein
MANTDLTCERDGFPMVKIQGRWECVAEYLDRCIGQQRVVDLIQPTCYWDGSVLRQLTPVDEEQACLLVAWLKS